MAEVISFPEVHEENPPEKALMDYLDNLEPDRARAVLGSFITLHEDRAEINTKELENVYQSIGYSKKEIVLCYGFIDSLVEYFQNLNEKAEEGKRTEQKPDLQAGTCKEGKEDAFRIL